MTTLTRRRGDTYADEVVILSAATGAPLDITGHTFLLTVNSEKDPVSTASQKYQLTGVILNALAGRVEFTPNSTQANLLGTFYYDIQMTDPAGRIRTIDVDRYIYLQDITKV